MRGLPLRTDYFYGAEAEQFSFYRIPKVLFTEERFRSVSAEAKVLYGLLLDRMSLSCKNGWLDKEGRVYIIFTIDEVMTALGCADQKAGKLLHELENKCRLIERKRQGLGKPNLIYVKNFVDKAADNPVDNASGSTAPSPESRFQNRENHDSGAVKIILIRMILILVIRIPFPSLRSGGITGGKRKETKRR